MNNISDYSVGQTVYVKLIGNAARYENEIQEWVIVKIGRKYITARPQFKDELWDTQFEQKQDRYNNQFVEKTNGYSPRFIMYQSMQEIKDEEEKLMLLSKLREQFYYGTRSDLSLEQLRAIDRAIKGEL